MKNGALATLFLTMLIDLLGFGMVVPFLPRMARELGATVGWYPYGHALKLQAVYFRLSTEDLAVGRHQVRVQAQLFF